LFICRPRWNSARSGPPNPRCSSPAPAAVPITTPGSSAELLDELLLWTHPAILGFGRPLFDDYDVPIELDLLGQRSLESGVTMRRYAIQM